MACFDAQRTLHYTSVLNTVCREPCPPCWVMAQTWTAGTNKGYLHCMSLWRSGVGLIRSLATRLFTVWWSMDITPMSICLMLTVLSPVHFITARAARMYRFCLVYVCVCLSVHLSVWARVSLRRFPAYPYPPSPAVAGCAIQPWVDSSFS